jgi:hypothetical protein
MTVRKFNERETLNLARRLIAKGATFYKAAQVCRVHYLWLRCRLDPDFRQSQLERSRARYISYSADKANPDARAEPYRNGKPISDERLRELRSNVPEDTRDFTARFLGDPLPWRSALAQKGADHDAI